MSSRAALRPATTRSWSSGSVVGNANSLGSANEVAEAATEANAGGGAARRSPAASKPDARALSESADTYPPRSATTPAAAPSEILLRSPNTIARSGSGAVLRREK